MAQLARPPPLLRVQVECLRCGGEVLDPRAIDEWGRYCSARCYHARELPALFRQAA